MSLLIGLLLFFLSGLIFEFWLVGLFGLGFYALLNVVFLNLIVLILFYKLFSTDIRKLPLFVLSFVFLTGYFFKNYYAYIYLSGGGGFSDLYPEWDILSASYVEHAFFWVSVFCFFIVICAYFVEVKVPLFRGGGDVRVRRVWSILLITLCVFLAFSWVRGNLGIGIMGKEVVRLPLNFDTVIFRFQENVAPAIFLLMAWVAMQSGNRFLMGWSLFFLLVNFVILSFLSGSKSGLIYFMLYTFFFFVLSGTLTKKRLLAFLPLAFIVVVFYAYLSEVRVGLIEGQGLLDACQYGLNQFSEKDFGEVVSSTLGRIVNRVIGVDGVWYYYSFIDFNGDELYSRIGRLLEMGPSLFYTSEVVGVERVADFRSPGLLGVFLLAVGPIGAFLVTPLYVFLVFMVWNYLVGLRCSIPILAVYSVFVLQMTSEGTFHISDIVMFIIVVMIMRFLSSMVVAWAGRN